MLKRAQDAGVVRGDLVPEDVQLMLRMVGATTRPAPDGQPDGRALAALPRAAAGRDAPGGGDDAPAGALAPQALTLKRRTSALGGAGDHDSAGPPRALVRRFKVSA